MVLASLDCILSKASVMDLFNLSASPLFSFMSIKTIENSYERKKYKKKKKLIYIYIYIY